MIDLTGVTHHPGLEEIIHLLNNKTQNNDKQFFRTVICYFFGKIAATMRCTIVTKDRGEVPVNIYALATATSGFGKGFSVGIIENELLNGFQEQFEDITSLEIAKKNLDELAAKRASYAGTEVAEEMEKLQKEFNSGGTIPFTFDSGTAPAVKQLRHKLLLANCGAINAQIDEIGSNLIANTDLLTLFLELYDQGMVKQKLTKNTAENTRGKEIRGKTPTNMLLFGTPAKLFDGGQTEDQFFSFLDTGYARRCLFGHGQHTTRAHATLSAEEIFKNLVNPANSTITQKWHKHFTHLADETFFNWKLILDDDVAIRLMEYKIACEQEAEMLPEHEEIRKAEMSHRYFKALKLAGALAFIDMMAEISLEHMMQAILVVEESGEVFQKMLSREKSYVRLAKYIAAVEGELTHADLVEALPFYKSGVGARNEMLALAAAWGYKNHVVIKKTLVDGIELFQGETLKATDPSSMILSYSLDWAYNYATERVPFDQLEVLTKADNINWCNHAFLNGHRCETNVIPHFNMIVIDVDSGTSLAQAHELLKEYQFMTYTTKRHTPTENRYRLVMPINYELKLDADDYKTMMDAIIAWLPFKVDESANQRSRKWAVHPAGDTFFSQSTQLLDILPFIPKTTRYEQSRLNQTKIGSMDNLERWFATDIATKGRNNQILRFGMILVDSGLSLVEVTQRIKEFNSKLPSGLTQVELDATVLKSIAKKYLP